MFKTTLTKGEKIALLADFAFKLNHLAEIFSESEDIIRATIRNKTLLDLLNEHHKEERILINNFSLSYYTLEQKDYLDNTLKEMEELYTKEDCGVKRNVYNLLIAFALMSIIDNNNINGGS